MRLNACTVAVFAAMLAWVVCPASARAQRLPTLEIPSVAAGAPRHITTDDLARIRDIDTFSLSPDGARFAMLVRQARPETNSYVTAWLVGHADGSGRLRYLADGGEARVLLHANGESSGDLGGGPGRWSPDGRRFAYVVQLNSEIQIWVASTDGRGRPRQLTHNAANVRDFVWSADGRTVLYTVGSTRAERAEQLHDRLRNGIRLQDYSYLFRAPNPGIPATPLETETVTWRVDASGGNERIATPADQSEYAARSRPGFIAGGIEIDINRMSAALRPPVVRTDGAAVWLVRNDPAEDGPLPFARMVASLKRGGPEIICDDDRCVGQTLRDLWWAGDDVVVHAVDGPTDMSHSIYVWTPATNAVRTIVSRPDHFIWGCEQGGRRLVCRRESPLEPIHIAAYDLDTGAMIKLADVNPEFANFRLGRVDRIEWDVADYAKLGYGARAQGFILYPPDYDPARRYPVFVAPYTAGMFLRGDAGDEHPLLVYAANGFIVLNTGIPMSLGSMVSANATQMMQRLYDPALGYPHLTTLARSTFAGLDIATERASIDPTRVGTGGVSHGAFVPLYMIQIEDRIAAFSGAGGTWNPLEYYFSRLPEPFGDRVPPVWPETPSFWSAIDLADHLDAIEAPLLFNVADSEVIGVGRLVRRLSDARLPFEAYNFIDELHFKIQPAHRLAVYGRNLDWFRFWLQDIEDLDRAKAAQYTRWRELRALQCRNPKSLRDYCNVVSTQVPIVH